MHNMKTLAYDSTLSYIIWLVTLYTQKKTYMLLYIVKLKDK